MPINPTVLRAMQNAGASMEVILAAIEAQEELDTTRRDKCREGAKLRKRKERSHKKINVSQRDKCDTPPNDIYSNPPQLPPTAKAVVPPFAEKIVSVWNEEGAPKGLRRAQQLRGKRLDKLKLRTKEFGEETLLNGIRRLANSDWHTGKSGDWKAGLGWFLNSEENVNKALEFDLPTDGTVKRSPAEWLKFCEERAKKAREIGHRGMIDEWDQKAAAARHKVMGEVRLKAVK